MDNKLSKTVLVVDDEEYICNVLQACFEIFGSCNTLTTNSGVEGLLMAAQFHPDVIILDVMMPNMNGLAFLANLRGDPQICDIPVVLLTAISELVEPSEIAKLGVKGAIAKPFEPVKLFAQISQILGWQI